jgi:biopolymer transport protein ExbD
MASADDKNYDDINVTPMVDLYLVLLLIFIIMTTAGVQGMKVNLPRAGKTSTTDLGAPKLQAITINNEGKIALNTIPVTLAELEDKLSRHKASNPGFPVVVRGDRQTQYQGIMDVLEVLGRLQIDKIGLATQPGK